MKRNNKLLIVGLIVVSILIVSSFMLQQDAIETEQELTRIISSRDVESAVWRSVSSPSEYNESQARAQVDKLEKVMDDNRLALMLFPDETTEYAEMKVNQYNAMLTHKDGYNYERFGYIYPNDLGYNSDILESAEFTSHVDGDKIVGTVKAKRDIAYIGFSTGHGYGTANCNKYLKAGESWDFEIPISETPFDDPIDKRISVELILYKE